MTQQLPTPVPSVPSVPSEPVEPVEPSYDPVLVHHFIRLVGRPPTAEELARFHDGASGADLTDRVRRTARRRWIRMRAARLVNRL